MAAWRSGMRGRLMHAILVRRQSVLIGVIGLFILIEITEHLIIGIYNENAHIWFDVVVFLFLVPGGAWFMLSVLETTESERARVVHDSDLHSDFSQKLGNAGSWEELTGQIVSYAHRVAPRAIATLFVFNPTTLRMEAESICSRDGSVMLKPEVTTSPDSLPLGSLPQLLMQNGTGLPILHEETGAAEPAVRQPAAAKLPPHRYDLPVIRSDQQIGVLKLEYPIGVTPTQSEIRALKSSAPVMALALEGALLQNMAVQQAAASEAQRQQIAQNLHDTLAQNISFLRLKLDQLTGEHAIQEIGAVLQELERMRTTADEAYQQVRNTLDELNPAQAVDFSTQMVKHAHTISKRASFSLRSSQVGNPYTLSSTTRQQILYIVREALHNIEKHAQAQQVHLQFLWLENELIIKITDDGVGFDPRTITGEGHYGLWIMQHRAQEIGGTLKIAPAEEHGTEVTLWVPRPGCPPGSESRPYNGQ